MIDVPLSASLFHGGAELETVDGAVRLHRLPLPYRSREADGQLRLMESQPSGVRLVFGTRATTLELELRATRVAYKGLARERGAVDVTINGDLHGSHPLRYGNVLEIDMQTGGTASLAGEIDRVSVERLAPGDKHVEIWLPHNEQVDVVALRADAPVHPLRDERPVWIHHGSSISHGSNAATPLQIWPAVAARGAGMNLRNLGFGGSAVVDPFMARVIRDAPADAISVKLGINVVNLDAMRARSFVPAIHGFLDTIREGHPRTPLALVSPIFCGIHEETPGPGSFDVDELRAGRVRFVATGDPTRTREGALTLEVIRDLLAQVVRDRAGDPHLHFISGLDLYGPEDAEEFPLPDGLHPDTATHELIARRFVGVAFAPGGSLRPAGSP